MTALIATIFFLIGLYLAMRGGYRFIDFLIDLCEAKGLSRFVVGGTLAALCTAMPKLVMMLLLTQMGEVDFAVSSLLRSMGCSVGLILGISALLAPALFEEREARTKGILMLATACLAGCILLDHTINLGESLGLLALLFAFLAMSLQDTAYAKVCGKDTRWHRGNILQFMLSWLAVLLGSNIMIYSGTILVRVFIRSEPAFAWLLGVVCFSLLEFLVALIVIFRRQGALLVGYVVGTNIMSLTLILPACVAMRGGILQIHGVQFVRDFTFIIIMMMVAVVPALCTGRMNRLQGLGLLAVFGAYFYGFWMM